MSIIRSLDGRVKKRKKKNEKVLLNIFMSDFLEFASKKS